MNIPAPAVRARLARCLGYSLLPAITTGAAPDLPPPALTEVWSPQPPAVDTTGPVPSDAIVLFDGSSLAAWTGESGPDMGWRIEPDGVLTITPGTGGIATKADRKSVV